MEDERWNGMIEKAWLAAGCVVSIDATALHISVQKVYYEIHRFVQEMFRVVIDGFLY